ncbi:MAG: FAD:protein FMN transferase [Thermodesulfobacteriota bacterium]
MKNFYTLPQRRFSLIFLLFFLMPLLWLQAAAAAQKPADTITRKATVMGTNLEVTYAGIDKERADKAFAVIVKEFRRVENELSEWRGETYVIKINKNAGKAPVAVPHELFMIIKAAEMVSRLSKGAFDITWASMWGLWDFSSALHNVPDKAKVQARLKKVNYRAVVLDEVKKTVFLREPGMAMGLGGIAKGYAVDSAISLVNAMGIKDIIIKAGGDMRVQGTVGGELWRIGIRHPRDKDKLLASLSLRDISISTSGDYEHFFIKDGVLYHHIIDARTGYPARGSRSVTVLGPDTMTTDALSTAIFVMGPKEGMALVERLKGIEVIIVDSKGGLHTSRGITGLELDK